MLYHSSRYEGVIPNSYFSAKIYVVGTLKSPLYQRQFRLRNNNLKIIITLSSKYLLG